MTDKSLGQIAFEASEWRWAEVFVSDDYQEPPWDSLSKSARTTWETAAQAVADEVTGNLRKLCKELEPELDAMIESPGDYHDPNATTIACKLYDAIMDPEEAKLAEEQVLEIRASGGTQRETANRYGVSRELVSQIKLRKI